MSFQQVSTIASLLFLLLFVTLVLVPEIVYWLFKMQGNELGDFLAKRAGMLFLGLSILCFYSRKTKSREVEKIVSLSVGTAMGAMALLGVYELFWGHAGLGILVAVFIEVLIAASFFRLWLDIRPSP
ncbi:hypothetical protein [Tateyamaria sp.]|uniref:hypothetical protein n=1 Tax=Tateyamaria sp. TaxID=1929288 RepID=UPI0032A014FB